MNVRIKDYRVTKRPLLYNSPDISASIQFINTTASDNNNLPKQLINSTVPILTHQNPNPKMSKLIGTIGNGFEITPAPQGFLKEATGTVKRVIDFPVFITVRPREEDLPEAYPLKATEFVPEPSGVPNVGDLMMGYWIRDGSCIGRPGWLTRWSATRGF
jgi:hypothetical protein